MRLPARVKGPCLILAVVGVMAFPAGEAGADWPQFMRDGAHTGDAADEALQLPLGLIAQVKLDDAVMTSPAVVGGRAWVVDQMGTAYCLDIRAGRVIWRVSPDGQGAMGSNTSSPAVLNGRVCFGTTAGRFHILDAETGGTIRTVNVGSPVVSSPTVANERIYFQAADAVLRCLDLDGNVKWTWDHYRRYEEPAEVTAREKPHRGHPGSYDRPHYGGGEVAASGKRIVTSFGWDLVCLEDKGASPELAWCSRAAAGRDGAIPMSSSISGQFVYTAGMGADGVLALMRFSLADGTMGKGDSLNQGAFPWITPAVRGDLVTCRNNGWLKDEIQVAQFGQRRTTLWQDPKSATPVVSSHALTRDHLLATTLLGELLVLELAGKAKNPVFRFATPNSKPIGSSPAISGGRVVFGCDDGYLYVLGPDGKLEPRKDQNLTVHEPRSPQRSGSPAAGRAYGWPSTCGNPGNTSFVDDPDLQPPLRLRWAVRGFGHFKSPCVAAEGDLFTITLDRTVSCLEQATGRLRWRRRVPPESWAWNNSSGLLVADGRLYVPCPNDRLAGQLLCLDVRTGQAVWSQPAGIGKRHIWDRGSPVLAAGKVIFGHTVKGDPPVPVVQAWDAVTGDPAWTVEFEVSGNRADAPNSCTDGKMVYFTLGNEAWQWKSEAGRKRGQTVAIDAATGRVVWRSDELFGVSYPVLAGDRLLLNEYAAHLSCLSTKDFSVLWQNKQAAGNSRFSVGADHIASRGYGGGAMSITLADGKPRGGFVRGGQLGGDTHACGAVALTPRFSFAVTVGGLNVRDARTGELLWLSPGFAPRGCVNASLAGGRVFFPSAASGMVFCWEPAGPTTRSD